jgi:hypothetical protein
MKNITLTVDDDVYAAIETEAGKHQTSVSALVEGYWRTLGQNQSGAPPDRQPREQTKNRQELVRLFQEANLVLGYKPSREKTYDR